jgi:hypothetical protein
MRIGREMRKAVQNSVLWERYRAARLIKAEDGQGIAVNDAPIRQSDRSWVVRFALALAGGAKRIRTTGPPKKRSLSRPR